MSSPYLVSGRISVLDRITAAVGSVMLMDVIDRSPQSWRHDSSVEKHELTFELVPSIQ